MKAHQIKIIAGNLKGRNLRVINSNELRPTPNRVRETLFNWLLTYSAEANCLDLFAGTGVLGFEAISRGAKHVTFIEKDREISSYISTNIIKFDIASKASLINTSYSNYLAKMANNKQFDIIFLDPPYDLDLLPKLLQQINIFNAKLVYIEDNKPITETAENANYEIIKQQKAGQVHFALLKSKEISPTT